VSNIKVMGVDILSIVTRTIGMRPCLSRFTVTGRAFIIRQSISDFPKHKRV